MSTTYILYIISKSYLIYYWNLLHSTKKNGFLKTLTNKGSRFMRPSETFKKCITVKGVLSLTPLKVHQLPWTTVTPSFLPCPEATLEVLFGETQYLHSCDCFNAQSVQMVHISWSFLLEKLHGIKSGTYGGWRLSIMILFNRNCYTRFGLIASGLLQKRTSRTSRKLKEP